MIVLLWILALRTLLLLKKSNRYPSIHCTHNVVVDKAKLLALWRHFEFVVCIRRRFEEKDNPLILRIIATPVGGHITTTSVCASGPVSRIIILKSSIQNMNCEAVRATLSSRLDHTAW